MNWIKLNNQVIIKDNEGKYQLDKDKEALNSYLDEYISPKIKKFNNLEEKLQYLIENEYYCKDTLNKYSLSFITNLFDFIKNSLCLSDVSAKHFISPTIYPCSNINKLPQKMYL